MMLLCSCYAVLSVFTVLCFYGVVMLLLCCSECFYGVVFLRCCYAVAMLF